MLIGKFMKKIFLIAFLLFFVQVSYSQDKKITYGSLELTSTNFFGKTTVAAYLDEGLGDKPELVTDSLGKTAKVSSIGALLNIVAKKGWKIQSFVSVKPLVDGSERYIFIIYKEN
jgi:hypothetical protein